MVLCGDLRCSRCKESKFVTKDSDKGSVPSSDRYRTIRPINRISAAAGTPRVRRVTACNRFMQDNTKSLSTSLSSSLTKQFTCTLCAGAVSHLLRRIGRWSGREIACTVLSLARSAQAERDNESCFFVRAAGVHRFIRRYHVNR
ncbi:hypothetical protein EVAR_61993_1 [Eumeta japonica]|uniref:Uncharacterized protein n=1 Tax=Eumeta variegata TaxID=151549 RepID=A0A4C1YEG1_EUMVA|nr:hypothetical protein EVAR_61993_1 [Eumeta japonica]